MQSLPGSCNKATELQLRHAICSASVVPHPGRSVSCLTPSWGCITCAVGHEAPSRPAPGLWGHTTRAVGPHHVCHGATPRVQWGCTTYAMGPHHVCSGAAPRMPWGHTTCAMGPHHVCHGATPRVQWGTNTHLWVARLARVSERTVAKFDLHQQVVAPVDETEVLDPPNPYGHVLHVEAADQQECQHDHRRHRLRLLGVHAHAADEQPPADHPKRSTRQQRSAPRAQARLTLPAV